VITLLMLLTLAMPGQTTKRNIVLIDAPDTVAAHAGKEFEVPVQFHVQDGFHINSNKPTEEYLIPTRIDWDASGAKHVADDFPPAELKVFGFTNGKKFSVFEGQQTIKVRFTAPATPGNIVLDGVLRYQACDQKACYPPSKAPVHVTVKVDR
jgi:hypothetical protein